MPTKSISSPFAMLAALILFAVSHVEVRAEQAAYPAGSPVKGPVTFQYAVYYLPTPSKDPHTVINRAIAMGGYKLKAVSALPKSVDSAIYSAKLEKNVSERYAPPDLRALQYFGKGLSKAQAENLQKSQQALIINFAHPVAQRWEALHTANQLIETVARETNGLIWDEETRLIFTPDEWHEKIIASWSRPYPDISKHTTIHAYKNGEYVRAITLGMSKFGLPDIVVQNFPWSSNRSMGNVINLFSQAMAEGARFAKPGEYDLDLKLIKNKVVREAQTTTLMQNASAIARLGLKQGEPDEGDPHNRLIEITFERYSGKDVHAKQDSMLSSLFGAEDSVYYLKHTDELLAASRKAKERLPALYKAFNAGLMPGEFIQLKAPFKTDDDGREWMWVEVSEWKDQKIKGLLKNEPEKISNLHGGQIVEIKQQDVFDYLRTYPDGKSEGNETSKIIMKMNSQ